MTTQPAAPGDARSGFVRLLARDLAAATPDHLTRPLAGADGTPLPWFSRRRVKTDR
ncbi:hypothetical protein [Kitasatospora azatica]|uniref:hypothetical protein n=1 Tax=Kitasatospora azatica TaxID=58347 RepID=UPI0012FB8A07|nr:hypothetical protein [Kitasatospora azatica]